MSALMKAGVKDGVIALSPRARVLLALALLLGLAAWTRWGETSVVSLARVVLGGVCLAVLGGWWVHRERTEGRFTRAEPLRVVSRAGLSPRCGLALVEVEGRRYVVVFGDSFAQLRPVRAPVRMKSRSPRREASAVQLEEPRS